MIKFLERLFSQKKEDKKEDGESKKVQQETEKEKCPNCGSLNFKVNSRFVSGLMCSMGYRPQSRRDEYCSDCKYKDHYCSGGWECFDCEDGLQNPNPQNLDSRGREIDKNEVKNV